MSSQENRPLTHPTAPHTPSRLDPRATDFIPSPYTIRILNKTNVKQSNTNAFIRTDLIGLYTTEHKGTGTFARLDIPPGTWLLSSKPMFTLYGNHFSNAWKPYSQLGLKKKAAFDRLTGFLHDRSAAAREIRSRLPYLDGPHLDAPAQAIEHAVAERVEVMGKFASNCFQLGETNNVYGIFPTATHINHSCRPNVICFWDPSIQKLRVHTTRLISVGEEIMTCYGDNRLIYRPTALRQNELYHTFGFVCDCPACVDPVVSDARRVQISHVTWGLDHYEHGVSPTFSPQLIPADDAQAAYGTELLAYLLIEEGIIESDLCRAFYMASFYSWRSDQVGKAWYFITKCREIERMCFGEESADSDAWRGYMMLVGRQLGRRWN